MTNITKKFEFHVIADSSALFSLAVETDHNFSKAVSISKDLGNSLGLLTIPSEIFAETINILGKKQGRNAAIKTAKAILSSPSFKIESSTLEIIKLSLQKFDSQPNSVSFTDCLVMAFADKFETKEIFGFDETFRKNGYLRIGIDS